MKVEEKKVKSALDTLLKEMNERYELLNAKVKEEKERCDNVRMDELLLAIVRVQQLKLGLLLKKKILKE